MISTKVLLIHSIFKEKLIKTQKKILSAIIGSAFVASLAATPIVNAAANPFAAKSLASGYMVAEADTKAADAMPGNDKAMSEGKMKDGKCSTGKCGASKKMAMKDKAAADAKAKEGNCSAEKKMKEGNCSAEKK